MTPLKQPARSQLCGQTVVAMILGIPLADAVRLVGHRRGTKANELRQALRKRGVQVADKTELTRLCGMPARAIVRINRPTGRHWHWMLCWDGRMHNPGPSTVDLLLSRGWEITSFIEVRMPDNEHCICGEPRPCPHIDGEDA